MDRIRDVRPPGSPLAAHPKAPQLVERILSKAAAGPNGCVIWTGSTDRDNYGQLRVDGKYLRTHRVLYQLLVGSLDSATNVDHVCHNDDKRCAGGRACLHRRCINPHHLDAVSSRENSRRSNHVVTTRHAQKTHCPQGHPYDESNTYVVTNGGRACRECRRAYSRAYKQRVRAAARGQR